MQDETGVEALASASDDVRPLPDGEYAIVEVLGHRTLVGRVSEVERFGTKLLSVEPLFQGELLPAVLIGGGSLYQFTACSREVAKRRSPTQRYQLPASVQLTLLEPALPAPSTEWNDNAGEPVFAPAFLHNGDDGQ